MLKKRRRLVVVGAVIAIVVGAFLVLILVPVPQHFAMTGAAIYDPNTSCTGIDTTKGTTISFHWSAPSFTYFFVVSCSANEEAYSANGTSGSGSLVSLGGVYQFGGSCPNESFCVPANVSGTYTGPLLPL
ncbi:MAG TPA: hypothetical protein VMH38_02095 [Thermoplasmata archaeon]|nr:hypothetical protein [Thermoplasmata archaeon]